jgi:two-component system phosphate regulon sensor histidine kinase PhoR
VIGATTVATAVLVLAFTLFEEPLVEVRETERARDELRGAVDATASALRSGGAPDAVADRIGAAHGAWVTVLDSDGVVIGDSASTPDPDRPRLLNDASVRRARAHGDDWRVARRPTGRQYVQVAVADDDTVVIAARPTSSIEAARASVRELILTGGLISLLVFSLLALAFIRTIARPIGELTRFAGRLSEGDLSARTRSVREDEIGRLGRALDGMADRLQEQLETHAAGEARIRTVLDGMVEAVLVTDERGRITLKNRALDQLAGADAIGRTPVEAIRSAELHDAIRRARRDDGDVTVELSVSVGGEDRSLVARVAPLPERRGVVAVLHDVTDLKRMDRVRRDFVANASHELRTPLTAIRGFAETLRDGALADPAVAGRFLDTILNHTLRLQRLAGDLLVLSRAEAPETRLELGPIDAAAVAREVVAGLESQARKKGIELQTVGLEALPPALGEPWALDQVLVNLIDNAIKYTPDGGRVTVRGSSDGDAVTIAVEDTGPGIPALQQERIFERFYRLDTGRSREAGGTGLGLSIVKHLAAGLQAEVRVESEVGNGARFQLVMKKAA